MSKVTVILTTYNGATRGYLEEAINSILNQSFKDYELIIVDDGSKDETNEMCKKYLVNDNVRYLYQENRGLAAARNLGIKNSKSEYICFLDDDDVWERDKLDEQIDFYKKCMDKKVGMVYTSLNLIDEHGNKMGFQSNYAKGNIYKELFYNNIVDAPSSVMIKKDVIEMVGYFNEFMKSDEDWEFWLRVSKKFNIYSINKCLVNYRIHDNKMSTNHKEHEFYHHVTLFLSLRTASEEIKKDENKIYNNLYKMLAHKHFTLCNYKECRKYYHIAKAYGNIDVKTKIKYYLCYFPRITMILKKYIKTKRVSYEQQEKLYK